MYVRSPLRPSGRLDYWTPHFDSSLIDFDLDSRSQVCKKVKTFGPIVLQSFQSMWMGYGILLRLAGVLNLILILSCLLNIPGRQPCICDFVKKQKQKKKQSKTFKVRLFSVIYGPISLKPGMMVGTTKLYILMSVWMTWPSFKVTFV